MCVSFTPTMVRPLAPRCQPLGTMCVTASIYCDAVAVLVDRTVLADIRRWWVDVGEQRGVDKAEVYELLEASSREVEATWPML